MLKLNTVTTTHSSPLPPPSKIKTNLPLSSPFPVLIIEKAVCRMFTVRVHGKSCGFLLLPVSPEGRTNVRAHLTDKEVRVREVKQPAGGDLVCAGQGHRGRPLLEVGKGPALPRSAGRQTPRLLARKRASPLCREGLCVCVCVCVCVCSSRCKKIELRHLLAGS